MQKDFSVNGTELWELWKGCTDFCNYDSTCDGSKASFKFTCQGDVVNIGLASYFPSVNYNNLNIYSGDKKPLNNILMRYCKPSGGDKLFCIYFLPDSTGLNDILKTRVDNITIAYNHESASDTKFMTRIKKFGPTIQAGYVSLSAGKAGVSSDLQLVQSIVPKDNSAVFTKDTDSNMYFFPTNSKL
jgi:hypothetical protein